MFTNKNNQLFRHRRVNQAPPPQQLITLLSPSNPRSVTHFTTASESTNLLLHRCVKHIQPSVRPPLSFNQHSSTPTPVRYSSSVSNNKISWLKLTSKTNSQEITHTGPSPTDGQETPLFSTSVCGTTAEDFRAPFTDLSSVSVLLHHA